VTRHSRLGVPAAHYSRSRSPRSDSRVPIPAPRSFVHRALTAAFMALVTISDFTHAQYVVRPSPVIDPATVPTTVTLAGLLTVRHTQDSDTATDMIRNARMGVTVRPRSTLVLKFQVDFAGAG